MTRLFGTDGVRGVANTALTPELAYALGRYGTSVLLEDNPSGRPFVLVGRDTRISGGMLEAALTAGIASVGADVCQLGVIPTPGVAYLTRAWHGNAGVMISASHNPAPDNGIKFFSKEGYKLEDHVEDKIESLIVNTLATGGIWAKGGPPEGGLGKEPPADGVRRPTGQGVGRIEPCSQGVAAYREFLKNTIDLRLDGLKIVVDSGNGAAYKVTPGILAELGAEVISLSDEPDGMNINVECGSTKPQVLARAVCQNRADLGIAHDGDADRIIAVDELGNVLDGDYILTICGLHLLRKGRLAKGRVVVTVYSNLGVEAAFREAGGDVVITDNGDRYVLEAMREQSLNLGGEQSGHIIFLDHNTTGDGALTALQLLAVMQREGKSLSVLSKQLQKFPQVLVNVPVKDKHGWEDSKSIKSAITEATKGFGNKGRIFVRASGTEPLIRVMAEGPNYSAVKEAASQVAKAIKLEMGS